MPTNNRSYAQQTRNRLVIWFIVILFTIGLGLIWIIYGIRAAFLGLLCLLGTSIPIGLIAIFLFGIGKIADRE